MMTWVAWGAVVFGVALVIGAATAFSSRLRPLRRSLRRLSRRFDELRRVRERSRHVEAQLVKLQNQVDELLRARDTAGS
jgi:hypothetical protein